MSDHSHTMTPLVLDESHPLHQLWKDVTQGPYCFSVNHCSTCGWCVVFTHTAHMDIPIDIIPCTEVTQLPYASDLLVMSAWHMFMRNAPMRPIFSYPIQ